MKHLFDICLRSHFFIVSLCLIIILTTMESNKDLNRLKVVLAEKKKSNLWLSKELGCAPTTVSKWCTNSSQPPLGMLMKMAKILDVEIMDLINKKSFESI